MLIFMDIYHFKLTQTKVIQSFIVHSSTNFIYIYQKVFIIFNTLEKVLKFYHDILSYLKMSFVDVNSLFCFTSINIERSNSSNC